MMIICAKCKTEMRCLKNSMVVRFRESGQHAYASDLYSCPVCSSTVAITNNLPYFDPDAKTQTEYDIWMDADKGFQG